MYTEGQAIEVEVAIRDKKTRRESSEWLPGKFLGYTPGDVDEDFERISVELKDGRRYSACHPNCVRPVDAE